MSDSGFLIAGMTLLVISIGVADYKKKQIEQANEKTDLEIIKIGKQLSSPNPSLEKDLETICRLRRKKSHLQKDIQNVFVCWLSASMFLIFIGISSYLGLGDSSTILEQIVSYLFILSILTGLYYLLRLTREINNICRKNDPIITSP